MQTLAQTPNPFAMMLDPQAVLAAIDQSDLLARLQSQIFRPLDKPMHAQIPDHVRAYDEAIDYEADLDD